MLEGELHACGPRRVRGAVLTPPAMTALANGSGEECISGVRTNWPVWHDAVCDGLAAWH